MPEFVPSCSANSWASEVVYQKVVGIDVSVEFVCELQGLSVEFSGCLKWDNRFAKGELVSHVTNVDDCGTKSGFATVCGCRTHAPSWRSRSPRTDPCQIQRALRTQSSSASRRGPRFSLPRDTNKRTRLANYCKGGREKPTKGAFKWNEEWALGELLFLAINVNRCGTKSNFVYIHGFRYTLNDGIRRATNALT